jgi:hypothetical protein
MMRIFCFIAMGTCLVACDRDKKAPRVREVPFPTLVETGPFPELSESKPSGKGGGKGPSSAFERAIARRKGKAKATTDSATAAPDGAPDATEPTPDAAPAAPSVIHHVVSLGGRLVADLPEKFDDWKVSSDGGRTVITYGRTEGEPEAFVLAEPFSPEMALDPHAGLRGFRSTVVGADPEAGIDLKGLITGGLKAAAIGALDAPAGLMALASVADSATLGRGLGFTPTPGTETGWRWIGRNGNSVAVRMSRIDGKWGPQAPLAKQVRDGLVQTLTTSGTLPSVTRSLASMLPTDLLPTEVTQVASSLGLSPETVTGLVTGAIDPSRIGSLIGQAGGASEGLKQTLNAVQAATGPGGLAGAARAVLDPGAGAGAPVREAYLIIGNATTAPASGVHFAILCARAPRCTAARELADFIASIRVQGPGDTVTEGLGNDSGALARAAGIQLLPANISLQKDMFSALDRLLLPGDAGTLLEQGKERLKSAVEDGTKALLGPDGAPSSGPTVPSPDEPLPAPSGPAAPVPAAPGQTPGASVPTQPAPTAPAAPGASSPPPASGAPLPASPAPTPAGPTTPPGPAPTAAPPEPARPATRPATGRTGPAAPPRAPRPPKPARPAPTEPAPTTPPAAP